MSFEVETIPHFDKKAKRLVKKFPSLKKELTELGQVLSEDPTHGIALGQSCFKIRLAIASKGKGKSGGARVITYVYVAQTTVFLLDIFDKSEQSTITDKEIQELIKNL